MLYRFAVSVYIQEETEPWLLPRDPLPHPLVAGDGQTAHGNPPSDTIRRRARPPRVASSGGEGTLLLVLAANRWHTENTLFRPAQKSLENRIRGKFE